MWRLVAKGEGQVLEFKPGAMRPTELAASLAAFANADGGTRLLRVLERRGKWGIHPSQNAPVNEIFSPSAARLDNQKIDAASVRLAWEITATIPGQPG